MRTPPDQFAKCECCGKRLEYQIGSIAWQTRDNDLCGFDKCLTPDCRVITIFSSVCSKGTKGCAVKHE